MFPLLLAFPLLLSPSLANGVARGRVRSLWMLQRPHILRHTRFGEYPTPVRKLRVGVGAKKDEQIDISVLWDDSKELPEFEEPPEWSIEEGSGESITGQSWFIDDDDQDDEIIGESSEILDDPFAKEHLTLENFDQVVDGDTISDDLLSFDLEDFGLSPQNDEEEGKQNGGKSSGPSKDISHKELEDFLTPEHIAEIDTLHLPTQVTNTLKKAQRQADVVNESRKRGPKKAERIMMAATGEAAARVRANPKNRATHKRLRIIGGTKARKVLVSPRDANVRPMMEKVRAALFNLLSARWGGGGMLPQGSRWLDLFGGTGSVGIEALSRGAESATFVELDRWVVKNILKANLNTCGFLDKGQVLNMKAEDFLYRSVQYPQYAGKPFDFMSVCPPYQLVSYPELFGLLSKSPLVHNGTYIIVEYPLESKDEVPDKIVNYWGGSLIRFRNRPYGRTWMAVYGPTHASSHRINPNRIDGVKYGIDGEILDDLDETDGL